MAEALISVTRYIGTILPINFLSTQTTLLLNALGSTLTGLLNDVDGLLSDADDGIATFNGNAVNYIGSGWVQPGISAFGVIVPTGFRKDVMVFQAGGNTYFHYPDGPPNLLSAVAMIIDIDTTPYQAFTPTCFAEGTLILTPDGERLVEDIEPGDLVRDHQGADHVVRWRGGRSLEIAGSIAQEARRPVLIRKGAFGRGMPARDLRVSKQHRILIEGQMSHILFDLPRCLAAAVTLVNDRTILIDHNAERVTYHHILCDTHVALVANGLPAESLSRGDVARDSVDTEVFEGAEGGPDHLYAPVLKRPEAQLYSQCLISQP